MKSEFRQVSVATQQLCINRIQHRRSEITDTKKKDTQKKFSKIKKRKQNSHQHEQSKVLRLLEESRGNFEGKFF